MHAFTGYEPHEPLVGEIRAVRTFRVEESGWLLPLFSEDHAWYDGANTATCAPPTGDLRRSRHRVVAPECECGFYAYGSPEVARQHRQAGYVLAVVSCWGRVLAGTRGVRAEHARIEAIWLAASAPHHLRRLVMVRYPSAAVYDDRAVMLARHPLSQLPSYDFPPRWRQVAETSRSWLAFGVLIGLGTLPDSWRVGFAWRLWLSSVILLGAVTVATAAGLRMRRSLVGALLCACLLAWLLAPLAGWRSVLGWTLRSPVLLMLAGGLRGVLVRLRPGYFPSVPAARRGLRSATT